MATEIVIPKLGMTMEKAKVVEWKAAEGERINEGQVALVIETEKVTHEVEALAPGLLHILAAPGTEALVGEAVGVLAETEAELSALQQERPGPAAAGPVEKAAGEARSPERKPEEAGGEKVKISPAAKKIAKAHNLDISKIPGTGPGGRIKREDVEQYLARGEEKAAPKAEATPSPAVPTGDVVEGKRVKGRLPLSGIRGVIAEHMHRSLAVSAQLSSIGELDATELVRLRKTLLEKEQAIGVRISYTDILVFMLAKALRDNPIINASLVGNEILLWEDIHIGVAVSLPWQEYDAGLVVPVVKDADQKSLVEISREVKALRTKAESGRLGLDDITGGTFTLSNVGVFGQGYGFATPIINQPQSAILGTGAIMDRAVVVNGEVVVRPVMNYSLTFDHRVINGAPVGKFLGRLAELVADPYLLLLP